MVVTQLTNEAQIKLNLGKAAQAKKYSLVGNTVNLLYAKYLASPPGTTYLQIVNQNTHLLTKDCGCR